MDTPKIKKLALQAAKIRKYGLQAIKAANSGHVGGSFSVADILTVLYFDKMNMDSRNPGKIDRDRLVLSKGHCTPALYATLACKGYFPLENLKTFRNIDSDLSGHAEMRRVPGVDMSTGSLGQGLSAAIGMALMGKQDKMNYTVYAILGDGEIQEGQIWEAAMSAGQFKLDNLIVFIDNNGLQLDGTLEKVMSPYPIDEKFRAFNWKVLTINGHNYEEISDAIEEAKNVKDMPVAIVAKTVKGKGVSFMENDVLWHGHVPSKEQFIKAFDEISAVINSLEI